MTGRTSSKLAFQTPASQILGLITFFAWKSFAV